MSLPSSEHRAMYARAAVRLGELEQLPVGSGLLAGLTEVQGMAMDAESSLRAATLWAKLARHCEAQAMIPISESVDATDVAVLHTGLDAQQVIAHDLAVRLKVPFGTAMSQVTLVGQVAQVMPQSWTALDRGELSTAHLKALARVTSVASPRVALAVEARVLPRALAADWTPGRLANEAEKVLIALDPDAAARRAAAAREAADVVLYPERDESATLVASGDALSIRQVMDAVDVKAAALGRDGDERPVGQRRIAALTELVLGPRQTSRPVVEAVLTLDLTTWLGLNEQPGEISGYGPITAETARRLADDAALRRLITDPMTGRMLDLGHSRYRPSRPLRRQVEARHRTCRAPGCHRPATKCQIDHRRNFDEGGPTSDCNLHPLCERHHDLKTRKLWKVDIHPDGSETWTTTYGYVVTTPPAHYRLDPVEPIDAEAEEVPADAPGDPPPAPPVTELVPLPDPPPLDDEQYLEVVDALDNGWGEYAGRVYDTLRAAGLVA